MLKVALSLPLQLGTTAKPKPRASQCITMHAAHELMHKTTKVQMHSITCCRPCKAVRAPWFGVCKKSINSHACSIMQPAYCVPPRAARVCSMQVHEMMGVTEKVPRVGGRELDLHMLYRYMSVSIQSHR